MHYILQWFGFRYTIVTVLVCSFYCISNGIPKYFSNNVCLYSTISVRKCDVITYKYANINRKVKPFLLPATVHISLCVLRGLPVNWPCEWNDGIIPFAYNFYLLNPKRLVNVAKRGIDYIEARSCLRFKEYNPVRLAKFTNVTYLFFTFSDVLEYCCAPISTYYRRRVVMITPLCTLPALVAHVTLHSLGLGHEKRQPFSRDKVLKLLYSINCTKKIRFNK